MQVGFIGAGSMGSLLVGAFVRAGALSPEHITVSSRTYAKAAALADKHPGLRVSSSNLETARGANVLFLCVKPGDYRSVLDDIGSALTADQIVVSITSPVLIGQLERLLPCKITKIIPSVVNAVGGGASLVIWGTRLADEDRETLLRLFSAVSRPVEIAEEEVRVASDLSSCGPAFFAYLLGQFIEASVYMTGIDRQTATTLACEMLLGTSRLLIESGCSPEELQARVSVPGGITAAALEQLRQSTGDAFRLVLRATHDKFAEDLDKVDASLFQSKAPNSSS